MTTISVGNRRLLKLADILDKADVEHRKAREPTYNQRVIAHDCGTPGCAAGHWAFANPRRWRIDSNTFMTVLKAAPDKMGVDAIAEEFALTWHQHDELFAYDGCGGARTAKQAAKYIRAFVKKRSATERGAV